MKFFSRICMFLMAFSCAMPAIVATDVDTKKESTSKKVVKGVVRLPFEIGKNLSAGLMIVGASATALCAYLWLVEKVNAGGLNMTTMNLRQQYLEKLTNLGLQEQLEWFKIELYKNIDLATIVSGAATLASGFGYLLFKSFADVLR